MNYSRQVFFEPGTVPEGMVEWKVDRTLDGLFRKFADDLELGEWYVVRVVRHEHETKDGFRSVYTRLHTKKVPVDAGVEGQV